MWEEEPAIRLIIDFPIEEYAYLKKLAEKRGCNFFSSFNNSVFLIRFEERI